MSTLQVKGLPDPTYERLRARARSEHVSVTTYVTRLIERDLAWPSMTEWLVEVSQLPHHDGLDVVAVLDEARADYADH
jgi:hypothetical protein